MQTKLSPAILSANLTTFLSSWFLLTIKYFSRKYQWLALLGSGEMTRMLHLRTVLLAQTGICSGILPMTLRSTPHQSLPSSISASMTSPQWPYVHFPTRSHESQTTSALSWRLELPLSRRRFITRKLIRNPAMPFDEPSNRHLVNTGLRLNRTTTAPTLDANYYGLQREAQPRAAQWHQSTRRAKLLLYFEASNTETCMRAPAVSTDCVISLSIADVRKTYKQVNIHKSEVYIHLGWSHLKLVFNHSTNFLLTSYSFGKSDIYFAWHK